MVSSGEYEPSVSHIVTNEVCNEVRRVGPPISVTPPMRALTSDVTVMATHSHDDDNPRRRKGRLAARETSRVSPLFLFSLAVSLISL